MRVYTGKEELKEEILKSYSRNIAEFDNMCEEMKEFRTDDVNRTSAENLVYQVDWISFVLKWERDERNGQDVKTPANWFN